MGEIFEERGVLEFPGDCLEFPQDAAFNEKYLEVVALYESSELSVEGEGELGGLTDVEGRGEHIDDDILAFKLAKLERGLLLGEAVLLGQGWEGF